MNTTNKTKRKYTTEDEQVIIELVRQYPTNIRYALNQAALKLDKKVDNVRATYYARLRNKYPNTISVGSSSGSTSNVKNALVDKETGELTNSQLQPHQMVLRDLLNLPEDKRRLIMKLLV